MRAAVTHLEDARGAQPGMTIQGLADKLHVRIDHRGAQTAGTIEINRADGVTDSIGMDAQFPGDGADSSMLGVEVVTDLHTGFRTHHLISHLAGGMRGKGSTQWLLRPQKAQRRNGTARFSGPL